MSAADRYLRPAGPEDMDQLFLWANDPVVRRNAFHTEQILYEEHVRWFERMMADDQAYQYILCDDKIPAGQVRLNVEGQTGVISYSIAPEQRGRGLGTDMIMLAIDKAAAEIPGITTLTGLVKHGNTASARVFEKCGFKKMGQPEYILFEREIRPSDN